MAFCFGSFAGHAQTLDERLNQILANNRAVVQDSQRAFLLTQFDMLNRMTTAQKTKELTTTRVQQFLSCRAADVLVIVNGVGEGLPLVSAGARELSLRYGGSEISAELTNILIEGRLSWKSILGSGLDSIAGVTVETLTSYDLDKIEAEIQKSFPGTSLIAMKLKGERSFCGQMTLKLDMLKSLLGK